MDKQTDNMDLLDLIVAPCFCVRDNRIIQYNQAASRLFLEENAELLPLLTTGAEEYRKFSGGSLYLTLNISGQIMGAAVERRGGLDYFILESEKESSELRALALASRELRSPLSSVIITAERICSAAVQEDPGLQQQAAMLNKSLHQLLRIVGNMSAAGAPPSRQETCEISTVFQEIFEKAQALLQRKGQRIDLQRERTPLSKKMTCGLCGSTLVRRISKAGYVSWACRKHDRKAADYPNGRISEDSIHTAFLRMYHKLRTHDGIVLSPILKQMDALSDPEDTSLRPASHAGPGI